MLEVQLKQPDLCSFQSHFPLSINPVLDSWGKPDKVGSKIGLRFFILVSPPLVNSSWQLVVVQGYSEEQGGNSAAFQPWEPLAGAGPSSAATKVQQ